VEMKDLELVDFTPGDVPAIHRLFGQLHGRDVERAFFCRL